MIVKFIAKYSDVIYVNSQCSLTEMVRPCRYCLKLDGSQTSFSISQAARNRVIIQI